MPLFFPMSIYFCTELMLQVRKSKFHHQSEMFFSILIPEAHYQSTSMQSDHIKHAHIRPNDRTGVGAVAFNQKLSELSGSPPTAKVLNV